MINTQKLLHELGQFTGTASLYKSALFPKYAYTDGVNYLAEETNCYWLIDFIFSNQLDEKLYGQSFQSWMLHVTGTSAVIVVEDGNNNFLRNFKIPFTNFPFEDFTIWFVEGVLLLPSEY